MNNRAEINDYIEELNYDPKALLTYKGNELVNYKPKTGELNGSEFTVTERKKYTIENDINVCITDLTQTITYPGALLYIDSDLLDGKPNPIPISRGSAHLALSLPNLLPNSIEIKTATSDKIHDGITFLLNEWYSNSSIEHSIPALASYESGLVQSEEEMLVRFGCDVNFSKMQLGIDFEAKKQEKTSLYMVMYRQVFYDASINIFTAPSDAFGEQVTLNEVKQVIDNKRVPGYVQSVAYGREVFFKFESKCSENELETAIKVFLSKNGATAKGELSEDIKATLEKTSCSLIVLGGRSETLNILLGDEDVAEKINKIIFSDVVLSQSNPAYPLMYKTVFLKDANNAEFHGTTDYTVDSVTKYNSGEIQLRHTGAYIAKFTVTWDTISDYEEDGSPDLEHHEWDQNGQHKTAGFSTVIPFPANACNLRIKCEGMTGLAWDKWHVSFDKTNIPLLPEIKVSISGTTLDQKVSTNIR